MTGLIQIYLCPLLVLSLFICIHCLLTSQFLCGHSLLTFWLNKLNKLNVSVCKSVPVTGPVVAQGVGRDIALLFHDCGTRRG